MAKIALNEANINRSTVSNHIYYRRWEQTGTDWEGYPTYGYRYYYTSAIINGTTESSVTNVMIEGKRPVVQGNNTVESDSYSLPSGGEYVSGSHSNTRSGSVTSGNSRNVYINGKSVAIIGSNVQTHANTNTTIRDNGSTTVNIG